MTTNITNKNNVYTIAIDGKLNTITSPELERVFNEIEPKADKVIFDMSGVEYISSAGMRTIIYAHRKMAKKGRLTLLGLTNNVSTIINLTGFDKVLDIK